MNKLIEQVKQWHYDRTLIDGSTDLDQFGKLLEEVDELRKSMLFVEDVIDDKEDIMVVLINIMERNNYSLTDCLETAWEDIKDRKGRMVDGIFVKEE